MSEPVEAERVLTELSRRGQRVLLVVVAYEAERHVTDVFDRVPAAFWNHPSAELLYLDDASSDRSPSRLQAWLDERRVGNAVVARNPYNQGYGGNQKLGFRYAIDNGFDLAVLLHGDGQYAPELLPEFIARFLEDDADVVLGTRMRSVRRARAGGMPRYKVVANRALTRVQNALTGLALSEYHTGYRAYATAYLRSVPFEINTNDFHFDTQVLLQAANVGARIREIDIPTHYGDEVCRVNGLSYGLHVLASTLRYRLHQAGMMCSMRYRRRSHARYQDKADLAGSSHDAALELVARFRPRTLVDLGCGPGHVAERCRRLGVDVTGVDREPPRPGTTDRFVRADLDQTPLPLDAFAADGVLLLDVIEHLSDPERFLIELREHAAGLADPAGRPFLIITTPNVAFVTMRLNLLLGRFTYADRGILDVTHKRLFNRRNLLRAVRDCGYDVEWSRGLPPPFGLAFGEGLWAKLCHGPAWLAAWVWPSLFAFQVLLVCRPKPSTRSLLSHVYAQRAVAPPPSADAPPRSRDAVHAAG